MVNFRKLQVGDVIYKRSKSVRFGPSAVPVEILELHADYALVRKGKDQPPERMYRKETETCHKLPFPIPGGGRIATEFGISSHRVLMNANRAKRKVAGNG